MSPKEFEKELCRIFKEHSWDLEMLHAEADDLMCKVLTEKGYGEGVKMFLDQEMWYA